MDSQYMIHSLLRHHSTKFHRMSSGASWPKKLFLGPTQMRLVDNQPLTVSVEWMKQNYAQLRTLIEQKKIKLTNLGRQEVDFDTLQVISKTVGTSKEPQQASNLLKDDEPAGYKLPSMPGVLADGVEPSLFDNMQEHKEVVVPEPPVAPTTATEPVVEPEPETISEPPVPPAAPVAEEVPVPVATPSTGRSLKNRK